MRSSWRSRSRCPLSTARPWTSSRPQMPISRPRNAFCRDSWKVRPIAMTSPTDFICVVSRSLVPGNFSNVKRGNLGHDVVDRGLERRRRRTARDVILQLVQRVADQPAWQRPSQSGNRSPLDASADDRDTRGFISMISTRPSSGLTANCTLEPPVSTPILRSTSIEASRSAGIPCPSASAPAQP